MTRLFALGKTTRRNSQHGVASIEFALIAFFMLVMLLGLFVFWRAYQAQQSLTRAAGDAARMTHSLIASGKHYPCGVPVVEAANNRQVILSAISTMVQTSLEHSGMPGVVATNLRIESSDWFCNPGQFNLEIIYTLPPLLGGESRLLLEPAELTEKSVVHFAPLL